MQLPGMQLNNCTLDDSDAEPTYSSITNSTQPVIDISRLRMTMHCDDLQVLIATLQETAANQLLHCFINNLFNRYYVQMFAGAYDDEVMNYISDILWPGETDGYAGTGKKAIVTTQHIRIEFDLAAVRTQTYFPVWEALLTLIRNVASSLNSTLTIEYLMNNRIAVTLLNNVEG